MKKTPSLLTLSLVGLLSAVASPARAEGDHRGPHSVALMLAPTFGLSDETLKEAQFDVVQSYLYHFSGSLEGLHAGIEAQEGGGKYFHMSAGIRAGYELQIPKLPLYVTPVARMGFAVIDTFTTEGYFNLCLGAEARYAFSNGVSLMLRPVDINMSFGKASMINYDVLAGVGYTF